MQEYVSTILMIGNLFSVLAFLLISREINRTLRSHAYTLGHKFKNRSQRLKLRILQTAYFFVILLLNIVSYILIT